MRRSVFLVLLVTLLAFAFYRYHYLANGNGHRVPEKYTPASGPKIDAKDVQVLAALDAEYSRIVAAVIPSVVSITTQKRVAVPRVIDPFELFFNRQVRPPQERVQTSLGSGVIVSREGHILTNHHVIRGMDKIDVQLTDGRVEPAQLIGSDEQCDIAVLKINAGRIEPLPLGNSDELQVGQMVFAVGNPFGLSETVTKGIISAKGRLAMADSAVEFLQTDAAVNQGNSGGPLLNLRGEIIGINTAIYSETGGWLGISFAVPSNVARRALESLLKTGRIVRGYLGVAMMSISPEIAQQHGLRDTSGALVTEIMRDSPAERAGLKLNDVIRKINGREVRDIHAVRSRVAEAEIGAKIALNVLRAGQEIAITATIEETPSDLASRRQQPSTPQPQPPAPAPSAPAAPAPASPLAGVTVAEIPAALRAQLPDGVAGVVIATLAPDTRAAERLREGDVIEEVNQQPVRNVADYQRLAATLKPGDRVLLYIIRGNARSFVVLTP